MAGTSRRVLLAGAGITGAAALGGCSTYGGSTGDSAPQPAPATGGPSAAGGGGAVLAKVSDIPVGGGKIFAERQVVVTQPQAGSIKAFSAICTHAGCTVDEVARGTINCPCHGSRYRVADGSVAAGPAPKPLPPIAVTVSGDTISLA
jgi:Rieske Fe-S protein